MEVSKNKNQKSKIKSVISLINTYFPYITIVCILFLGAYLRLYRIQDYMTFLGDEGRDVLVVKRMIVDHKFTLLGPTASVGGFFLGPIYYYFMAPFLWVFNLNPVGPAVMVALFGIATIFMVYLLGKKLFNIEVGLTAALLYALSPVVINYSHSSWNPNIVPFFAAILIFLLTNFYSDTKPRRLFLIGAVFGIGLQLHYLFSFLAVMVVFELLLIRKRLNLKILAWGLAGFLLTLSPFILFELRHGFPNLQLLIRFVFTSGDTGFSLAVFLTTVKDLLNRLFFRLVAQNNQAFSFLAMLIAVFGLWYYRRKVEKNNWQIFILWLIIPLFLFGLYKKEIYDYYLGIIFPAPFLLTALGFSALWRQKKVIAAAGAIFLSVLIKINWDARPFVYEPNRQLAQAEQIARFVLDKTNNQPFNFALITGQNSDYAYRYFFEVWGKKPITIENQQIDPKRETVTNQLLVICEINDCQPLGNSLWEVAGFGRAEIAGKWKVTVLTVYKLIHFTGKT